MLCRIYLDIRICNKKKGGAVPVLLRKMFEIGLRLDFVQQKKKIFHFSLENKNILGN